jgi:Ca2+-binding RTX toxin-like protein
MRRHTAEEAPLLLTKGKMAVAKHTINQDQTTQWHINESNDSWVLAKDATISTNYQTGIYEDNAQSHNTIVINGDVEVYNPTHISPVYGIHVYGTNTMLKVNAPAQVAGDDGVVLAGANQTLINAGKLIGTSDGAESTGLSNAIVNSGLIKGGSYGVNGFVDLDITNQAGGQIQGLFSGINYYSDKGLKLVNDGLISGGTYSVHDGDGDADIKNTGVLKGDVDLGAGNDKFDTRGGKLIGEVDGGTGDDTYFTDTSYLSVNETLFGGTDTVKSSASFTLVNFVEKLVLLGNQDIDGTGGLFGNKLFGNAGNNILSGNGGNDELAGGKGNDRLIGGEQDDMFIFKTGDGHDVITDFIVAEDSLDLSGWSAITSFQDLMKNHVTMSDGDMIISAGDDQLILRDVNKNDLSDSQVLI